MNEPKVIGASGQRYWRERASCLLAVNQFDRVLLARRSTKVSHPHLWGHPGGYCDEKESFKDCVVREATEELGPLPKLEWVCYSDFIDEPFTCRSFLTRTMHSWIPILNEENEDYGWSTRRQLQVLMPEMHFNTVHTLKDLGFLQ